MGCDRVAGAPVSSRAGTAMWPSITESTPASTAARKGRSSTDSSRARSGAHRGQLQMAVDRGVPVAGEVLGGGEEAARACAGDEGGGQARHQRRVFGEGPDVDDRIAGIVVDVRDRGESPVNPQGSTFASRHLAGESRRALRPGRPHRHRVRQRHHPAADAEADAPFHVRRDQQGNVRGRLKLVQEPGQGVDLGVEHDDRSRPQPAQGQGVTGCLGETGALDRRSWPGPRSSVPPSGPETAC